MNQSNLIYFSFAVAAEHQPDALTALAPHLSNVRNLHIGSVALPLPEINGTADRKTRRSRSGKPSVRSIILEALRKAGRPMSNEDIALAVASAGWGITSGGAARSGMVKDGLIVIHRDGAWALAPGQTEKLI